ncbi:MAG: hypothetical protein CMM52_16430 [Rhodospirillaceae bacterium]|nr:hypothetical protein [Rhodospirillaceae bacterium]|tara:strand:- start:15264 stop:17135 length:1872 start_codon:yes stop_codon:yes gene_type:complete
MKTLSLYGLFCIFGFLAIIGIHRVFLGDQLIFHSDIVSLYKYFGAVALVVAVPCILLASPVLLLPMNWRAKLEEICFLLPIAAFITVFVWFCISYAVNAWPQSAFGKTLLSVFYGSDLNFGRIPALIILISAIILVWRRHDRPLLLARVRTASTGFAVALLLTIPTTALYAHLSPVENGSDNSKHMVFIVLDGLPSQFLQFLNPNTEKRTTADEVFSQSTVFENVYTSAPFTYAYFGTLYTGQKPYWGGLPNAPPRTKPPQSNTNLLDLLQKNDVAARWIVYRRLGTPEGSATQNNQYKGLRSNFLTSQFYWIPALLGIDYHLFLNTKRRKRVLTEILSFGQEHENVFIGSLLPQIAQIKQNNRKSFTIFHIRWNLGKYPATNVKLDPARSDDRKVFHSQIEHRRYQMKYDHIAQEKRDRTRRTMEQLGVKLKEFFSVGQKSGWLENVTFLVTGDHGSIFSKGRYQYYIHPNEEVIRTPVFLFNGKKRPNITRPHSTPDLTASILEFFGVEPRLSKFAKSIFGKNPPPYAATLTSRQEKLPDFSSTKETTEKNWILVILHGGRKFTVNLHPGGDGAITEIEVDGIGDRVVRKHASLPETLRPHFNEILQRYGILSSHIHKNLH